MGNILNDTGPIITSLQRATEDLAFQLQDLVRLERETTNNALQAVNEILGNIIGVDSSTVSRIIKRTDMSHKKAFEASILLIRIYRSLFAILGGNQEAMKHWLNTENTHLGGKPIQRLQEWIGLSDTVHYLDAMRGKT